jgi:hypothetical protein
LANNPNLLTTEILSLGGLYGELDESKLLAYDSTFTRLGVRANFKSFIGNAKYGDYGLKITIYDKYD